MNSLSWMIYAADVADDINVICECVLLGSAIAGGFTAILWAWHAYEAYEYGNKDDQIRARFSASVFRWVAGVGVSVSLLGAVVPDRNTIYAIAASEMGERVIQSPTGAKAMKALNAWLDKQIAQK